MAHIRTLWDEGSPQTPSGFKDWGEAASDAVDDLKAKAAGTHTFEFDAEQVKTEEVSLPGGRFSSAPVVVATVRSGAGIAIGSTLRTFGVTSSKFDLSLRLTSSQTGSVTVAWVAVPFDT